MITDFILQNQTTKESVIFGGAPPAEYLCKPGDIDWGSVPAQHNTYEYANQVGVSISSTKLNPRDVYITGYIYYWLTESEKQTFPLVQSRHGYAYSKIEEKKETLSRVVNPDNFVRIVIGDYYIEGKPAKSVEFGKSDQENNEYFCSCMISIFCAYPMFKKNIVNKTTLSGKIPRFHFPLIFPNNRGIVMSIRRNYLMLLVENEGNVEIGGKIILQANGIVKNPMVENVGTGQVIKINKTLARGEVVTINTVNGKDRGVIGEYRGVIKSYFEYWNFNNEWFKFQPGTNLIGYGADDSTESALFVTIEINPAKFNLENM